MSCEIKDHPRGTSVKSSDSKAWFISLEMLNCGAFLRMSQHL